MGNIVAELESQYSVSDKEWQNLNVMDWAQESHSIATEGDGAYSGVTENDPVPQEYLNRYIPKMKTHILRGGLRLYHVIKTIFGSKTQELEAFLN